MGRCRNMRKERPRILDRDGLTHEMDESTDTTRPHTCPKCGTTRSRNAVPYLVLDHAIAEYTCAVCGARASAGQRALRAGPMRMASARLRGERENVRERDPSSIDADASAPLSRLRRCVGARRRVA